MNSNRERRQAPVVTTAPVPVSSCLPKAVTTNKNLSSDRDPVQHQPHQRGPLGNIAAASSSYVVSSIGGMINRMSEYFEMQTISDSSSFGGESDDYDDYYDASEEMTNSGRYTGHPMRQSGQRGIFAGISNYFQPWRKYQPVPVHNENNKRIRRNSSSVDGDINGFSTFPEDTSFCDLADERFNNGVYQLEEDGEGGQGHKFVPTQLLNIMTWCDKCGELIWGFYKQCLRCTYCKYTCHYKCVSDVRLDCAESPELRQDTPDHSPQHTLVSLEDIENELESFVFLTREELEPKIEQFNTLRSVTKETLTLNEEGTQFCGQVTIYINLSRPVSVRTGCPLPDVCVNTLNHYEHSIDTNKRRTTFFMPKSATQELSITCYTTAQDVIRNVLALLQLIDNPRKFALFERTEYNGEVLMRKMVDEDKPLYMCLSWVKSTGSKKFELRENETGVIEWEAFTVPELQNFLRILDREEEDYIRAVEQRYLKYNCVLQEAIDTTLNKTF